MEHFKATFFSLALSLILLLALAFAVPAELNAQDNVSYPAGIDTSLIRDMDFRDVGPTRGGRVTAVEGHKDHPYTFYMGAAGGSGVWRTTNYGEEWTNLTDGADFKSTSIGSIEVTESDTSIIYVGTGSDAIRSNVTVGRGVYKSTDAGESWEFIGLEEGGQIGAIKAHPGNPDLVYAAALGHPFGPNEQRGVFRSEDGGESWEHVLSLSDSTGATDLEFNPENPDEIYAAMWRAERKPWTIISGADEENGLYKSTDGGDSWEKLGNGLPDGLTGKMDIGVSPADPDRIYTLVEAPGDELGLYRSDDRGESWVQTSDTTGIMNRPFYFTTITAHPTHPDTVYVGNVQYWVSTDGGETFERRPVTHADVHDLWINPEQPDIQIQGNDGGATITLDEGKTWSTQLNQPTAELYQVDIDDQFPYWLYAGQQDNTTISVPSLPPAESAENDQGLWHMAGGCETGPAVPQHNNPSTIFANCKGRFGVYHKTTGQEQNYPVGAEYMYGRNPEKLEYRFQRTVPIEISPHDSSVVYNGSQYVHKTTNGGQTWERISPDLTAFKPEYQVTSGEPITRDITGEEHFSALYAIEVSPHDWEVIWVGSNDGPVHITRDGGDNWTDITPENMPPNGRIDGIAPSPHNAGTAYVAMQRRLLDDFAPYVYKTTDYGQSWELLTNGENGVPADFPVRSILEDPNREDLLYAGTDFGLFFSLDDGQNWQQLERGLPTTEITDIEIKNEDLVVSTMGRGFWILDNLTPIYQLDKETLDADYHLFEPRDAYRMRYYGGGGSDTPQYLEAGALIDFYLDEVPEDPVTIEILGDDNMVVRRFVGTAGEQDSEEQKEAAVNMDYERMPSGKPDTLSVQEGHNRITWDFEYPSKSIAGEDGVFYGPGSGPMAAPGSYTVRLSAGDWSKSRDLEVRIDPRVAEVGTTVADLEEQEQLNLKIRDAIGQAHRMETEIDDLRKELSEDDVDTDRVDELYEELVTKDAAGYHPPMLIDQLEYLYNQTNAADQKPGEDVYERYDTLSRELEELQRHWQSLQRDIK